MSITAPAVNSQDYASTIISFVNCVCALHRMTSEYKSKEFGLFTDTCDQLHINHDIVEYEQALLNDVLYNVAAQLEDDPSQLYSPYSTFYIEMLYFIARTETVAKEYKYPLSDHVLSATSTIALPSVSFSNPDTTYSIQQGAKDADTILDSLSQLFNGLSFKWRALLQVLRELAKMLHNS